MASFQTNANGTVRVQCDVRGKRASKTLPNMREARKWAVDKERELEAQVAGDKGHGKTLRDAFRKFADEVSPKRRGERWEIVRLTAYQRPATPEDPGHGFALDRPIGQITDDDIREWRDRRLKKNSRGAVLRDMALLSAVFEEARTEWKWIKVNPVREVKKPSKPAHRRRVITGPEIRNVLRMLGYKPRQPARTVSQSVAIAFLLALATGMRAGELCGLRWEDMRQMYGTAHNVKARERGVSRDVPMSSVARKLIERMRGWDDELVFGLSAQTLDALFRKARKRAGYTDFTFHDSRHTAATRIALSGKWNVLELCKAFGWSNPKMAMVYFNPTAEDLAAKLD
jgi:integrase